MKLTPVQQAILAMIAERISQDGIPPSQIEIAQAFGFKGVRGAQYHLDILEQAGAIRRRPGQARSIQLADHQAQAPCNANEVLNLPVLGRVAAGQPIGPDAECTATIVFDRTLFDPSPDYLLKVQGDSMRDAGILHDDLIGVHRTHDARSGQIVVARIDDEVTLKVLRIQHGDLYLLPCHPDYAAIQVQPDQDFAVEGLYCGLIRRRC